jgi:MFS family permease
LLYGISTPFVYTFLPLYALAFGATASDLGVMSAVSHSVAPFTFLAGAYLAERSLRHQRIYVLLEGLVGRGTLLLFALVPLFLRDRSAVWVLIGVQVARMTFFRLAEPSRTVITGRIVPENVRGRFMSSRSVASSLGLLAAQPLASLMIARYLFPLGYQYSFGLALIAGLTGALAFSRMPVPVQEQHQNASTYPLQGLGREVLADRRFLAVLIVALAWSLGDQVTRAFYGAHMVRNLGLDASTVGLLATAASLASLIGLPLMGLLSDRRGNRVALVVVGLALSLARLLWLRAQTSWQLLPIHLISGLVETSAQVIFVNLLLVVARPQRYARYAALYHAVVTTMSVLAPLVGGYLFENMGFSSNLVLASGVGFVGVTIAWVYIDESSEAERA